MIQPKSEGSTQGYPLVSVEVLRFILYLEIPVKEILLKLSLPDHRSILIDSKMDVKNVESSKELWDSLEAKCMAGDASRNLHPPSWNDFKHTLKHLKEKLTLVELVVNLVEHNNSSRYNDNKGKCKHHDNTKADLNKKSKVTCWKCGKHGHLKKDCKGGKVGNKANGSVDGSANSLKGHNMFNKSFQVYYVTYVSKAYFIKDDDVA
ncbi:zinc finger, CCHC-type containing protein [Tanacetum coccineum]